MKVLLAGGGTAGHINPAIAIAKHLKQHNKDIDIRFVGTKEGLEDTLVNNEGFYLYYIDIRGFKRKLSMYNIGALRRAATSLFEVKKILNEFKPDIVIGTGGYVSWPVLFMASMMKIKTVIHEQNAFPGLTTRLLSSRVDVVMISFLASKKFFTNAKKIELTGNPIREEMIFEDTKKCKEQLGFLNKPLVLSFGGSLGAKAMNENIIDFIMLTHKDNKFYHVHATGDRGYLWVPDKLKQAGFENEKYTDIQVLKYIYNMPKLMAAADIIICRAGAITLSEIAALGKCAVLVPSPNVTNDHQSFNAKAFYEIGAAEVIKEKDLSGKVLKQKIYELIDDNEKRIKIAHKARELAVIDSSVKIYEIIKNLIKYP